MSDSWLQAWLGFAGALIGTLASVVIALRVIRWQTKHDKRQAREERRTSICLTLLTATHEVLRGLQAVMDVLPKGPSATEASFDPFDTQPPVQALIDQVTYLLPLAHSVGGDVAPKFMDMYDAVWSVSDLWAEMPSVEHYFDACFRCRDRAERLLVAIRDALNVALESDCVLDESEM